MRSQYATPGQTESGEFPLETVWHAVGIESSVGIAVSYYASLLAIGGLFLLLWFEYRAATKERES